MKNQEIAKMFAEGKTYGMGNSMYIEGNVIYSYGTHFPMAIRLLGLNKEFKFIFNKDKYSSTTSKHQSCVRKELGKNIIKEVTLFDIQTMVIRRYNYVKELMIGELGEI